jgi:2-oxoisovalerate dehydrogenase E1 component alpha subunit
MNSDGVMLEKDRKSLNVSNEEILTWYRNMLTGEILCPCIDRAVTDEK